MVEGVTHPAFTTVEEAAAEFRRGRFVVIVDDEDRENEGDLAIAAEAVTPDAINFMATHGRGLICVALTEERCDELAAPADGGAQHVAAPDRVLRLRRGAAPHDDRNLGRRPVDDGARRCSTLRPGPPT